MLYLGADHGGWELKEALKKMFEEKGVEFQDLSLPQFDSKDDYPDIALTVAKKVAETGDFGVMICSTGTGSAVAANKVKGVRSASLHNLPHIILGRRHNDLNLLCLGALVFDENIEDKVSGGDYENLLSLDHEPLPLEKAYQFIDAFVKTPFEGGRHQRRVEKIEAEEG